jgi:hypothetical protein
MLRFYSLSLCSPYFFSFFYLHSPMDLLSLHLFVSHNPLTTHAQSAYSCTVRLLMHSLLTTHAQSAYSCAVCLLMHSPLTHAQPYCTVYKDRMNTLIR